MQMHVHLVFPNVTCEWRSAGDAN